jgi:hypothetical protein
VLSNVRVVGNTDISTRLLETSGLPVTQAQSESWCYLLWHGVVTDNAVFKELRRQAGASFGRIVSK